MKHIILETFVITFRKTTEITILHFFTAEIKKKVINIKSIFFFVFGLILIVLGILAGTIVALFGLALFILSIAMIMEKIKIKKLYKKLITLINKQD